jgi:hypothetical protein
VGQLKLGLILNHMMIVVKNINNVSNAKYNLNLEVIEIYDMVIIMILKKGNVKEFLTQQVRVVFLLLSNSWRNVKTVVVIKGMKFSDC